MIDSIKLKNLTTESEIELTKTSGNPFMLETDGIIWNEADATHSTYSNLTGVGDVITSTKLEQRTIAITGRICSRHTNKEIALIYGISGIEEIRQKKIEEIKTYKKLLSQLVNPFHHIRLFSSDYYIDGKPASSVTFSDKWKENNEIYCKFLITLTCEDPLFHYTTSSETQLSGVFGGFHFPVIIPKPNGMHFGIKKSYQLVNVSNTGDVALGGVICIKATGIVNSPVLTNVLTQEFIKINKSMASGEVIKVDTINRRIIGAVDGENFENYFRYWNFDNTWFQFDIGDTLFGFSTEDDTYKNMDVWIEINKSFYSMEDQ